MGRRYFGFLSFSLVSVVILIFLASIDLEFFHIITALGTIFIGLTIYIITFYSSKYTKDSNLLFLGVAYLFISIIDFIHLVNVGDFGLFSFEVNTSVQIWSSARFTEALVILFAYSMVFKKPISDFKMLFLEFAFITGLIMLIVGMSDYLPVIYDLENGYTLYKKMLDIVTIIVLSIAIIYVSKNESRDFNRRMLLFAISFKILSEFVFIFETKGSDILFLLRYLARYISYLLLFLVFARDLLQRPYETIYRAFRKKELELTELSKRDSLTGLYNHSTSYEIIKDIIIKNEKSKNKITLMMIDVDDFKNINDKYGHVKGDEILAKIGNLFRHCDKIIKLAGRYGGDEFVVLFDDCDSLKAKEIALRIFDKTEALSADIGIKVTLSIGISEWEKGFTAKDLVRAADFQMYEAKSEGKNTFSLSKEIN